MKKSGNNLLIVLLYVDDLLMTKSNVKLVNEFKAQIKKEFEMIDLGEVIFSWHGNLTNRSRNFYMLGKLCVTNLRIV